MIDKIKELLGEELSQQVSEKLGNVELAIFNDGTVVPADKYDTLKGEHKALQGKYESEIKDFNAKIEEASKSAADVDGLKASLDKLKQENIDIMEKYKADTQNIKIDSMIEVELLKVNADEKYLSMLKTQVNKDNLSFDGDKLVGLTDIVNGLQENFPKMFGEVKKAGAQPNPDEKKAPMGEKAKLMNAYDGAKTFAEKLAIQRKIKELE